MQPGHIPRINGETNLCECGIAAEKHKVYHSPVFPSGSEGGLCTDCGLMPDRHFVKHTPRGDICDCGVPFENHKKRSKSSERKKIKNNQRTKMYYMGIDGEGQGHEKHKYVMLCASNESGTVQKSVHNLDGLTTKQCLDFILGLSNNARLFAFSFNYDLTKILSDVPDEKIYLLLRPELRQRKVKNRGRGNRVHDKPAPVEWEGYSFNLQGSKFTLQKGAKKKIIWDIFKFYGSKFTSALRDWKVGDIKVIEFMEKMKDKRSDFENESIPNIEKYCYTECQYMAELVRRLIEAHEKIGLKLTSFYSAGSSASAMLNAMEIRNKIATVPGMINQIASAFFGGRFENSVIGIIPGPIYNYDISSAYPYQLCFLPCLQHGHWEYTTDHDKMVKAQNGLVRYVLMDSKRSQKSSLGSFGPFPFRSKDGSICYPETSGGGWIWREEYLAGERLFPNVKFQEAYIYEQNCECSVFPQIPYYYKERIRIGKEGAGIAIKLAMNSCYGKLVQSVGNAPFNCWTWGGLITSGTRAQILELLTLHRDPANMLMIATDGIYTRERLVTPYPKNTGTFETEGPDGNIVRKPLGGWEEKIIPQGAFCARPGVYFPMNPTAEQLKEIRGRGIGKKNLLDNWKRVIDSWVEHGGSKQVDIANVTRFAGAKSCISVSNIDGKPSYKRSERYGQWYTMPIKMDFNPMPKRECINEDKVTLRIRQMPMDIMSMPYSKTVVSEDAKALRDISETLDEQPDGEAYDMEYGE
jgi:hypothetical protein